MYVRRICLGAVFCMSFSSYAFLYGNVPRLGYFYGVISYIEFSEYQVLSSNARTKAHPNFWIKTYKVLLLPILC